MENDPFAAFQKSEKATAEIKKKQYKGRRSLLSKTSIGILITAGLVVLILYSFILTRWGEKVIDKPDKEENGTQQKSSTARSEESFKIPSEIHELIKIQSKSKKKERVQKKQKSTLNFEAKTFKKSRVVNTRGRTREQLMKHINILSRVIFNLEKLRNDWLEELDKTKVPNPVILLEEDFKHAKLHYLSREVSIVNRMEANSYNHTILDCVFSHSCRLSNFINIMKGNFKVKAIQPISDALDLKEVQRQKLYATKMRDLLRDLSLSN